jgi:actin-related protein
MLGPFGRQAHAKEASPVVVLDPGSLLVKIGMSGECRPRRILGVPVSTTAKVWDITGWSESIQAQNVFNRISNLSTKTLAKLLMRQWEPLYTLQSGFQDPDFIHQLRHRLAQLFNHIHQEYILPNPYVLIR